jgi:hypothetical protein
MTDRHRGRRFAFAEGEFHAPAVDCAHRSPAEQRPLYADMKAGIEKSFQGFKTIAEGGALMGPWNPWLHEPKFGKPIWDLTLALSVSPSLPRTVREVAILVTGAVFHVLRALCACHRRGAARAVRRQAGDDCVRPTPAGPDARRRRRL